MKEKLLSLCTSVLTALAVLTGSIAVPLLVRPFYWLHIKPFGLERTGLTVSQIREAYGNLAGTVGIVSNTIVSALRIAVGLIFSSISIMADGLNNLADASSSLITLIGFRMAS